MLLEAVQMMIFVFPFLGEGVWGGGPSAEKKRHITRFSTSSTCILDGNTKYTHIKAITN